MPNAPTQPPPQSLVISDFTPGIRQVASLNHPPGTADDSLGHNLQGTFGCYASPADGVLRALPKRTSSIARSAAMVFTGSNLAEQFRICGIFAMDPVYSSDAGNPTVPGPNQCNTELWVAVEYYVNGGAPGPHTYVKKILRYSRHATTPAFSVIATSTNTGATYVSTSRPPQCYFTTSRSNNASTSTPGYPIVAWAMSGFCYFFPDDSTPTVDSTRIVPNGGALLPPDQIIGHQNRLVVFPLNVGNGAGTNVLHPDNELIYWTAVNDARTLDPALGGSYTNVIAYPERDTGYEIQAVVSNDQLLLIKRAGGGLILQGDLNDYTVTIQPNIKSPGLALNRGCNSVIGYVYPTDAGGVWVLSGSMTSKNLSPFMEDNFWRPRAVSPANPQNLLDPVQDDNGWGQDHTSCASWQQWVLLPNNWLYDTDTSAWWRLDTCPELDFPFVEDPDGVPPTTEDLAGYLEAHWWTVDWTGRWAWSAPSGYSDLTATGADCVVFNEYDRLIPAETYQWLSHPLPFSIDKTVEITDIVLTWESPVPLADESKVTIEVIGTNIQAQVVHDHYQQTWCTTDEGIVTEKSPSGYGVQGTNLRLFIRSEAGTHLLGGNTEAPRIHRIEIQYVERSETPRNVCVGGGGE